MGLYQLKGMAVQGDSRFFGIPQRTWMISKSESSAIRASSWMVLNMRKRSFPLKMPLKK
jgi:hypothetical protein